MNITWEAHCEAMKSAYAEGYADGTNRGLPGFQAWEQSHTYKMLAAFSGKPKQQTASYHRYNIGDKCPRCDGTFQPVIDTKNDELAHTDLWCNKCGYAGLTQQQIEAGVDFDAALRGDVAELIRCDECHGHFASGAFNINELSLSYKVCKYCYQQKELHKRIRELTQPQRALRGKAEPNSDNVGDPEIRGYHRALDDVMGLIALGHISKRTASQPRPAEDVVRALEMANSVIDILVKDFKLCTDSECKCPCDKCIALHKYYKYREALARAASGEPFIPCSCCGKPIYPGDPIHSNEHGSNVCDDCKLPAAHASGEQQS